MRIRTALRKEETFYHFSAKDLVNFRKNTKDVGPT